MKTTFQLTLWVLGLMPILSAAAQFYDAADDFKRYESKLNLALELKHNLSPLDEESNDRFEIARREVRLAKRTLESNFPRMAAADVDVAKNYLLQTAKLFASLFEGGDGLHGGDGSGGSAEGPVILPPIMTGGSGGGIRFRTMIDPVRGLELKQFNTGRYELSDLQAGRTITINPALYASHFVTGHGSGEITAGSPASADVAAGIKKIVETFARGSSDDVQAIAGQLPLNDLELYKFIGGREATNRNVDLKELFASERTNRTRLFADLAAKMKGSGRPPTFENFDQSLVVGRTATFLATKGALGKVLLPDVLNTADLEIVTAEDGITLKLPVDRRTPAQIDHGAFKVGNRTIDLSKIIEIRPVMEK